MSYANGGLPRRVLRDPTKNELAALEEETVRAASAPARDRPSSVLKSSRLDDMRTALASAEAEYTSALRETQAQRVALRGGAAGREELALQRRLMDDEEALLMHLVAVAHHRRVLIDALIFDASWDRANAAAQRYLGTRPGADVVRGSWLM